MTLLEYLAEADLKPSQFAERLDMPASTILRILNGKRKARLATAAKIVAATDGKVGFPDLLVAAQASEAA